MSAAPYALAEFLATNWADEPRLLATVERLDSCETQIDALQKAALAHHAACPLYGATPDFAEHDALRSDLLEAVTLLGALWRAVPGTETPDIVARVERALGAR